MFGKKIVKYNKATDDKPQIIFDLRPKISIHQANATHPERKHKHKEPFFKLKYNPYFVNDTDPWPYEKYPVTTPTTVTTTVSTTQSERSSTEGSKDYEEGEGEDGKKTEKEVDDYDEDSKDKKTDKEKTEKRDKYKKDEDDYDYEVRLSETVF